MDQVILMVITGNGDRYTMHPYFTFKDLVNNFLIFTCIICYNFLVS